MAGKQVGLIRGINVGKAKRVSMGDLRAMFERLGYRDVRTLLNSGNVVFNAPSGSPAAAAAHIEDAMAKDLGVFARVTVITAAELAAAVAENPLLKIADNPSRLLVAVLRTAADVSKVKPLLKQDWGAEALAIGKRVAFLWCPDGILASALSNAVGRALGDGVTARNWATMLKLQAMAAGEPAAQSRDQV